DTESGRTASTSGLAASASSAVAQRSGFSREPTSHRWPLLMFAVLGLLLIGAGIIWFAMHRAPNSPVELSQRRLTSNSFDLPIMGAVIYPDGKYLAYGNQSGIHIKLIETGETQTIPPPERLKVSNASWARVSWFLDGTKLVAGGFEPEPRASIWTVSVLAGNARELRDDAFAGPVSPDGSHIALMVNANY